MFVNRLYRCAFKLQQQLQKSTIMSLPASYCSTQEVKIPQEVQVVATVDELSQDGVDAADTNKNRIDEESQSQFQTEEVSRRNPQYELEDHFTPYRFVYPEFLPDPDLKYRHRIREKLERIDMLRRREHLDIPEFYVGTIMKVAVSDAYAIGKTNEFLGICTERDGTGLRAWFVLRNVIDHQGVEIRYDMYSPIIQSIKVFKLEKRLDESLRYLRDCPVEYSTFPLDMQPVFHNPDAPVPINTIKVKLNPKPWIAKWHVYQLKGVEDFSHQIESWEIKKHKRFKYVTGIEVKDYDLMKIYRTTIPAEEQTEIYSEVHAKLASLTQTLRKQKKKRNFVKPEKTA